MGLLLSGLLGGVGQGLAGMGKMAYDEQVQDKRDAREDAKLLAMQELNDRKLTSAEKIAEQRAALQMALQDRRDATMMASIEAGIKRAEIQAGASERAAEIRAKATVDAILARDRANGGGNKPTAAQERVSNGLLAVTYENGMTPQELNALMQSQQIGQFATREQAAAAMAATPDGALTPNSYGDFMQSNSGAVKGVVDVLKGTKETQSKSSEATIYQKLDLFKTQREVINDNLKDRNLTPAAKAKLMRRKEALEQAILAAESFLPATNNNPMGGYFREVEGN